MLLYRVPGASIGRLFIFLVLMAGCAYGQQIQYQALYDCPTSSLYTFKVIKCDKDDCEVFFKNSSPEGGWTGELSKARIAAALRRGGCTMNGSPVSENTTPPAGSDSTSNAGPANPQASIDLGGDKQLAAGAACVSAVPPATPTNAASPSAALIKRVIYERYRDMESGRPVGVTFKTLALASSFTNRLTRGGLPHQSAPVGAMIYRYKTDLVTCVKYTDSIIRTEIKEGYYRCFRDKTGAWACADDGRRSWDQTYLPVE